MSHAGSTVTRTLAATLERDRLEHRASRAVIALAALRERAREHRSELGGAPMHVRQAIADFEAQLAATNTRLRDLAHDDASTAAHELRGPDENGHQY